MDDSQLAENLHGPLILCDLKNANDNLNNNLNTNLTCGLDAG